MKTRYFITILALACSLAAMASVDNERLLTTLDSLLLNNSAQELKRQFVVDNYRHKLRTASNDEERYRANNMLYEVYSTYSIDSAMRFLDDNMAIARRHGDTQRIDNLRIKRSFLLAAAGLLMESADEVAGLHSDEFDIEDRKAYYAQMAYLYDHLANYHRVLPVGANEYFDLSNAYKDSLLAIMTPDDQEYLWFKGWSSLGAPIERRDSIMREIEQSLSPWESTSVADSKNAYILGLLYNKKGDTENAIKYVAQSAIADVMMCNRDIASLQKLATLCLDTGDVERAHNYIGYCMKVALEYPNRVRASTIAPLQHNINAVYQERLRSQQKMRRVLLALVCALSLCFAIALVVIIKEMLQLKRQRHSIDMANSLLNDRVAELQETKTQLSEANDRLSEANDKLQSLNLRLKTTNNELVESNYVKEEYVGYAFGLCSHYIKMMDNFRISISRKAKAKQWDDIRRLTEENTLEKDALKEFYTNFDTIFLHLYPHFVTDFNNLLQSGFQVLPREGELLSTELRIYALLRLGITDSVKIAEFLHLSPQTVYNYRFRIRNRAILPKAEFIEAVKKLGHVIIE